MRSGWPFKCESSGRIVRHAKRIISFSGETIRRRGGKRALVVFGRCTNLPFASVSFSQREWIGRQIAARLDKLDRKEAIS